MISAILKYLILISMGDTSADSGYIINLKNIEKDIVLMHKNDGSKINNLINSSDNIDRSCLINNDECLGNNNISGCQTDNVNKSSSAVEKIDLRENNSNDANIDSQNEFNNMKKCDVDNSEKVEFQKASGNINSNSKVAFESQENSKFSDHKDFISLSNLNSSNGICDYSLPLENSDYHCFSTASSNSTYLEKDNAVNNLCINNKNNCCEVKNIFGNKELNIVVDVGNNSFLNIDTVTSTSFNDVNKSSNNNNNNPILVNELSVLNTSCNSGSNSSFINERGYDYKPLNELCEISKCVNSFSKIEEKGFDSSHLIHSELLSDKDIEKNNPLKTISCNDNNVNIKQVISDSFISVVGDNVLSDCSANVVYSGKNIVDDKNCFINIDSLQCNSIAINDKPNCSVLDKDRNNTIPSLYTNPVISDCNGAGDYPFEPKTYETDISYGVSTTCKVLQGNTMGSGESSGAKEVAYSCSDLIPDVSGTESASYPDRVPVDDTLLGECPTDRSDGSDSGLGSDLSEERSTVRTDSLSSDELVVTSQGDSEGSNEWEGGKSLSVVDFGYISTSKPDQIFLNTMELIKTSSLSINEIIATPSTSRLPRVMKSNLKRVRTDLEDSDEPNKKKSKKSIAFDNVSVFYFPRAQGFTCVPSQVMNSFFKLNIFLF